MYKFKLIFDRDVKICGRWFRVRQSLGFCEFPSLVSWVMAVPNVTVVAIEEARPCFLS